MAIGLPMPVKLIDERSAGTSYRIGAVAELATWRGGRSQAPMPTMIATAATAHGISGARLRPCAVAPTRPDVAMVNDGFESASEKDFAVSNRSAGSFSSASATAAA